MKRKLFIVMLMVMVAFMMGGCFSPRIKTGDGQSGVTKDTAVERPSTGKIALDQKGFYTYEDYNGEICAMLFCSYKNNTDKPILLTDISFGLKDSSGLTIGTSSNTYIKYAPEVVGPGQTGYAIATASDSSGYKIAKLDEPTEMDVRIESRESKNSDMTKILNTSDCAIQIGDTDYSTTMTCVVENPSIEIAYYNTVVGGLYDSNSKLIGCLYNLSDSTQIGPNEKAKYSLNGWMAKSNIFQNAVKAGSAGRVNYYEKDTVKINN